MAATWWFSSSVYHGLWGSFYRQDLHIPTVSGNWCKPSGSNSWMITLWQHISLGSWSNALMALQGVSSPTFFPILQIILKSTKLVFILCKQITDMELFLRVPLACIKFLGVCPCPCCLVKKADILRMGNDSDMDAQTTKLWSNENNYQQRVHKACRLMFKGGKGINSSYVAKYTKEESIVPICVHAGLKTQDYSDDSSCIECILGEAVWQSY